MGLLRIRHGKIGEGIHIGQGGHPLAVLPEAPGRARLKVEDLRVGKLGEEPLGAGRAIAPRRSAQAYDLLQGYITCQNRVEKRFVFSMLPEMAQDCKRGEKIPDHLGKKSSSCKTLQKGVK
jgi:hypothetical protein